jgi:hypothetical protein
MASPRPGFARVPVGLVCLRSRIAGPASCGGSIHREPSRLVRPWSGSPWNDLETLLAGYVPCGNGSLAAGTRTSEDRDELSRWPARNLPAQFAAGLTARATTARAPPITTGLRGPAAAADGRAAGEVKRAVSDLLHAAGRVVVELRRRDHRYGIPVAASCRRHHRLGLEMPHSGPRQPLATEEDTRYGSPKALAAALPPSARSHA